MCVFFLFFCNITDTKILLLSLPQANKRKGSDTRTSRADPDESDENNNNDEFGVEWNASSAKAGEKDNNDSDDEDDGDEWTNTATGEGNNKKESDGKKKKTTPRKEKKKNLKKTPDSTKTESPVIGSYERNVIEKRKRNQERIKDLGLEDATKEMKPAANKKKKNTKKNTKAPPTRKQASRKAKRGGEYDDESEKVEEHQKKNGGDNNEAGQKKDKDGGNNNKKASESSSHCIISDDDSGTDNSKVTAVTTPLIQKKPCCNKDCKVTDESPTYKCDGCDDRFHLNCLCHEFNDIDRCHSCAKGNALFSEPPVSVEEKKGDCKKTIASMGGDSNCSDSVDSETIAETDDLEAEVDYSKHYIVDCFLRHELEKKDKKNKNKRRRMMLLTHWKGWESKFDTLEPIEEKAEEEEALVLDYVKKHGDDILLNYIGNNENLFSQSFLAEVRALQKS